MIALAHGILDGRTYARGASDAATVDCSRAVGEILQAAYPGARLPWRDLVIQDGARPWSCLEAIVAAGLGRWVDQPDPGRWHVCQGWRRLHHDRWSAGATGHAWLWWSAPSPSVEPDWIIEATGATRGWIRVEDWTEWLAARRYDRVRLVTLDTTPDHLRAPEVV